VFPSIFRQKTEERIKDSLGFSPSVATGYLVSAKSLIQKAVEDTNSKDPFVKAKALFFGPISGASPLSVHTALNGKGGQSGFDGVAFVTRSEGVSKQPKIIANCRQWDLIGASSSGKTQVTGENAYEDTTVLVDAVITGDNNQTPTLAAQTTLYRVSKFENVNTSNAEASEVAKITDSTLLNPLSEKPITKDTSLERTPNYAPNPGFGSQSEGKRLKFAIPFLKTELVPGSVSKTGQNLRHGTERKTSDQINHLIFGIILPSLRRP
jgi:hypothetical protein